MWFTCPECGSQWFCLYYPFLYKNSRNDKIYCSKSCLASSYLLKEDPCNVASCQNKIYASNKFGVSCCKYHYYYMEFMQDDDPNSPSQFEKWLEYKGIKL